MRQLVNHYFAICHLGQLYSTVHTVLPQWGNIYFLVEGNELELDGTGQLVGVKTDNPFVVFVFCHINGTLSLPVA